MRLPDAPQHSWDLRLPIDLLIGCPEDEIAHHTSTYAEDLQACLERVHTFARSHMQLKTDSMKERYDAASNCDQLNVGDPVWLHYPQRKKGMSPKLTRQWQGPYLVTKRINGMVYRVQLKPLAKPKVVHRNRLWLYTGPSPPTWLQETSAKSQGQQPNPRCRLRTILKRRSQNLEDSTSADCQIPTRVELFRRRGVV